MLDLVHPGKCASRPLTLGLDPDVIVDGDPELLFAAEVSLGRFDGAMSEQELDLLKLAARYVAQAGARSPAVMRRQILDARRRRVPLDDVPDDLFGNAGTPD